MAIPHQTLVNIQNDGFSPGNHLCYGANYNTYNPRDYSSSSVGLLVSLHDDKFFIPTIAFSKIGKKISDAISNKLDLKSISKTYIIPLIVTGTTYKRTSSSIIKALLQYINCTGLNIVASSNLSYVGGTGLIMKDGYIPMIMWGCMGKIIDDQKVIISDPTVYVSPKVFKDEDILSKYISKRVIPVLIETKRRPCLGRILGDKLSYGGAQTVRVIIEDFSHMFYKPEAPTSIDYSMEMQSYFANDNRRILQGLGESNR